MSRVLSWIYFWGYLSPTTAQCLFSGLCFVWAHHPNTVGCQGTESGVWQGEEEREHTYLRVTPFIGTPCLFIMGRCPGLYPQLPGKGGPLQPWRGVRVHPIGELTCQSNCDRAGQGSRKRQLRPTTDKRSTEHRAGPWRGQRSWGCAFSGQVSLGSGGGVNAGDPDPQSQGWGTAILDGPWAQPPNSTPVSDAIVVGG